MLHLLGFLDRPTSGIYRLNGNNVSELDDVERTSIRGRPIGIVFHAFHVLPHRTVLENVVLAQMYNNTAKPERTFRARCIGEGRTRAPTGVLPTKLSGGERQRVAIARAVVSGPSILLADEPTGNLDTSTGNSVLALFDELHAEGLTIAMITHDRDVASRADRTVTMRDGELREEDL